MKTCRARLASISPPARRMDYIGPRNGTPEGWAIVMIWVVP